MVRIEKEVYPVLPAFIMCLGKLFSTGVTPRASLGLLLLAIVLQNPNQDHHNWFFKVLPVRWKVVV